MAAQSQFLEEKLEPLLMDARSGHGHVFFVDAAHFVQGAFCAACGARVGCSFVVRQAVSVTASWVPGMQ